MAFKKRRLGRDSDALLGNPTVDSQANPKIRTSSSRKLLLTLIQRGKTSLAAIWTP